MVRNLETKIHFTYWWDLYVLQFMEFADEQEKLDYNPYYATGEMRWEWAIWFIEELFEQIRYRTYKKNAIVCWRLTPEYDTDFAIAPMSNIVLSSHINTFYWWTFRRVKRFLLVKKEVPVLRYIHPYHIVDVSPWPLFVSMGLFIFIIGIVKYLHFFNNDIKLIAYGLVIILISVISWWADIICEATFQGFHTKIVQKGLRYGVLLFIVSEIMFFSAFFWAFFHSSLSPAIEIGGIWPPLGIVVLNPWRMPLLNTMYLLASGAWVTWAHCEVCFPIASNIREYYFNCFEFPPTLVFLGLLETPYFTYDNQMELHEDSGRFNYLEMRGEYLQQYMNTHSLYDNVVGALFGTISFGLLFTFTQWGEYDEALFTISDGIYGSVFYMATGFHGLHVIIGSIFLIVCLFRYMSYHFTRQHHVGLEAAIWYWHFVDVVWLFLYICLYHWGS